jgi:hypothetical protein
MAANLLFDRLANGDIEMEPQQPGTGNNNPPPPPPANEDDDNLFN